jgi:4a-hydroxytetrahydrobiopterin dehydratase
MSEQGWRAFLAADGVEDWVVLHGGATACYRVETSASAGNLARALSSVPELLESGALLTVSGRGLTVRLTRDIWRIETNCISLARSVTAVAREHGARPDRAAVQEVQLAVAALRNLVDVEFWRAVLGYSAVADDNAVDPLGHGSTVWMQELDPSKSLRHAMHIDVSVAREQVKARLSAAIAAGGRIVDDTHAPKHWTLSDRAGNRVCICGWPDGSVELES